ncbi:MAG: hypothetical protein RLZZ46_1449 [Bacteroidota bacterium]|jgi:thiol-disulfide isomerase/thioredoxin
MRNFLLLLFLIPALSFSQATFRERNQDWLSNLLNSKSDTVYVLNFWATWCVPCVEELPEFIIFHEEVKNPLVKMIFISLDSPKTAESKLNNFLTQKKVPGEIVVLNAPDYNAWIDRVDKSWQGSIPATLFFRGNPQKLWFAERTISAPELLNIHDQFIKP